MSDKEGKIAGAASVVGGATLLSRIFGYVRDMSIAYLLGAGAFADAFFVAFRIANLLRRLVGEGALTSSFVPIFTELLTQKGPEAAARLASRVFTLFFLILVALTILGVIFSPEIAAFLSPGFTADADKFSLTVTLTRLMFPYMLFIGLVAIAMGVLNSLRHFAAPALSPVLFNVSIIICAALLAPALDVPAYALAVGVLLGGVLQLALQLPFLKKANMFPRPDFSFGDPAIRKIFALMGPAAIGVGVYQLNIIVTLRFASTLPEGSVSYLYYATRLMELPLGVFGVAVSTAILPSLSEYVSKQEWDSFSESLSFAIRVVNYVIVPAMFAIFILGGPIVDVLFLRGEFTAEAAAGSTYALYFYAIGLVPVAVSRVLVSVFYSLKDTRTPLVSAFISFICNIVLCYLLIGPLKHGGLALATSISSLLNAVVLVAVLRRKTGRIGGTAILISSIRSIVAALIMSVILILMLNFFDWQSISFLPRVILLTALIFVGLTSYITTTYLLKSKELLVLKGVFIRKKV